MRVGLARPRLLGVVLGLVVLGALAPAPVSAASSYVAGQFVVTGTSGAGVPGTATLSPCPYGPTPPPSCTLTVTDGNYRFTPVSDGFYTVTLQPSDPNLSPATSAPVTISGGVVVTTPTFQLTTVHSTNTVLYSGVLRDAHGGAVGFQHVDLQDVSGATPVVTSVTAGDGSFQLYPLRNTTYKLHVWNYNPGPALHAPAKYDLVTTYPGAGTIAVGTADNTAFNLDLPEIVVHVCVLAPGGAPVSGVKIETDQSSTITTLTLGGLPASGNDWYNEAGYPVTDGSGCGDLWLFPSPDAATNVRVLTMTPADLTTMAVTSVNQPITVALDGTTLHFTLAAPVTFNGSVVDASGAALPGQWVQVQPAGSPGAPWVPAAAPAAGSGNTFSIPGLVLGGSYLVRIQRNANYTGAANAPAAYTLTTAAPVTIGSSAPVVLTVPAVRVPVTVTENGGAAPLPHVSVVGSESLSATTLTLDGAAAVETVSSSSYSTDAAGAASVWLFQGGTYSLRAGLRGCTAPPPVVVVPAASPAAVNIDLTCPVKLSGRVLDGSGAPLAGQTVSVAGKTATSAADGSYSVVGITAGTYTLTLSGAAGAGGAVPPVYSISTSLVLRAGRTGFDLQVPVVPLDVQVRQGSAGVAGAALSPPPSASSVGGLSFAGTAAGVGSFSYSAGAVTDASGNARMWVLPGTYTLTASSGSLSASGTATVPGAPLVLQLQSAPPVLKWAPEGASFAVDQQVVMACTVYDGVSGAVLGSCGAVNAPAYTFPPGSNAIVGSYTEASGRVDTVTGHFTVTVSASGLCAVVKRVDSSRGLAIATCNALGIRPHGFDEEEESEGAPKVNLPLFAHLVRLQSGWTIPAADAAALLREAAALGPLTGPPAPPRERPERD